MELMYIIKKKMKMEDFFDFGDEPVSSTIQVHSSRLIEVKNGIDEHWNLVKGIYEGINFPVTFKQEYGKKLKDILGTGLVSLYLISDKFKNVLELNQLTGWKTFPIKLYDKKGNEINGYHGFSITGHCSGLSYKKSQIIEKRFVPNGPLCKYFKGTFIENWDGSDFFTPDKKFHTFITRNAAEAIQKNKLTNVYLENLAEIEVDVDIVRESEIR